MMRHEYASGHAELIGIILISLRQLTIIDMITTLFIYAEIQLTLRRSQYAAAALTYDEAAEMTLRC